MTTRHRATQQATSPRHRASCNWATSPRHHLDMPDLDGQTVSSPPDCQHADKRLRAGKSRKGRLMGSGTEHKHSPDPYGREAQIRTAARLVHEDTTTQRHPSGAFKPPSSSHSADCFSKLPAMSPVVRSARSRNGNCGPDSPAFQVWIKSYEGQHAIRC